MIELRKKTIEESMEGSETPSLYTVLPEKKVGVGASMMGSAHIYDIGAVSTFHFFAKFLLLVVGSTIQTSFFYILCNFTILYVI